jgi:hypothetical protein
VLNRFNCPSKQSGHTEIPWKTKPKEGGDESQNHRPKVKIFANFCLHFVKFWTKIQFTTRKFGLFFGKIQICRSLKKQKSNVGLFAGGFDADGRVHCLCDGCGEFGARSRNRWHHGYWRMLLAQRVRSRFEYGRIL